MFRHCLEYVIYVLVATRVLLETGRRLKDDNPHVIEAAQVKGLKSFGESELLVRTTTKVKPGHHRDAFELRKKIKEAFDAEGIEIPFARRVLIFQNEWQKGLQLGESGPVSEPGPSQK